MAREKEALIEIVQSYHDDLESGGAWLNDRAAKEFKQRYPRLTNALAHHSYLVSEFITW